MGIAESLGAARARAEISTPELERRTGITDGQISKVERGRAGLSLKRVDLWLDACGARLVVAPRDAPDLADAEALPDDQRDLLLRLARLLPLLPAAHLGTIQGLVEHWEREGGQRPLLARKDSTIQASDTKSS